MARSEEGEEGCRGQRRVRRGAEVIGGGEEGCRGQRGARTGAKVRGGE